MAPNTATQFEPQRLLELPARRSATTPARSESGTRRPIRAESAAGNGAFIEVASLAGGAGILLVELCARAPGLLVCLLIACASRAPAARSPSGARAGRRRRRRDPGRAPEAPAGCHTAPPSRVQWVTDPSELIEEGDLKWNRPHSPSTARGHDRRWLILGVIALAQLMVVLDVTIVNIALPSAQADLGFSDDSRQWVITAYALAFGSLLLLGGKISDLIGRKWTFIAGPARLRGRVGARRRGAVSSRCWSAPARCRAPSPRCWRPRPCRS